MSRKSPTSAERSAADSPAATVLIIEDNTANRELAEQMLDIARYQYISTSNIEDAWTAIQRGGISLVLSDLHVNVLSLLHRMHADPQMAKIPVVIASGERSKTVVQAVLDAGATTYLSKPFGYDDLVSTLEQCLDVDEA